MASARIDVVDSTELRTALLQTACAMGPAGLNVGKSGNVSVRARTATGAPGFLVTASGLPYDLAAPEDVCWMPFPSASAADSHGRWAPSSEWRFHHDLYQHRPDIHAIVHAHPRFCTTLACTARVQREGIPPFHYMIAMAGGVDIRCAPYALFGTQALSDGVVAAMQERKACLLAHHGLLAMGGSLSAAFALAQEVEHLASVYWHALQLGEPPILSAAQMAEVLEKFSTYGPAIGVTKGGVVDRQDLRYGRSASVAPG